MSWKKLNTGTRRQRGTDGSVLGVPLRLRVSVFDSYKRGLMKQNLPAAAQEMHQHQHEHSEQLGRVNFKVSCTPEAQKKFNRAAAWLHSFEYEEAERAFAEVTAADPRCGMGYWGVAMSNYHPIWAPPSAADLKKGWEAVERAKSIGARTERERD